MIQKTIIEDKSLYRDSFRVDSFTFGSGAKDVCILGSLRGNEYQQLYTASLLIERLKELEEKNKIIDGHMITVIPCGNPSSMNIHKRFWPIDNTDINRMFPGYNLGETTQRVAASLFEHLKGYKYGIQFASFYMKGRFIPHVRMMKTGYENVLMAKQFGLPYVVLHTPRPVDTGTLNYNWQIWETNAFSIYTTSTSELDSESAKDAVDAILIFLAKEGLIRYRGIEGYISRVVESDDFIDLRAPKAGFFINHIMEGEHVKKGQVIASIKDCYTQSLLSEIVSPVNGTVAFISNEPLTYQNTLLFNLIEDLE